MSTKNFLALEYDIQIGDVEMLAALAALMLSAPAERIFWRGKSSPANLVVMIIYAYARTGGQSGEAEDKLNRAFQALLKETLQAAKTELEATK